MAEVSLAIHGQSYGIACDDGQEGRVKELGGYLDQRLSEIASAGAATNESHLLVLAGIVMADEIYELREQLTAAQQQTQQAAPQVAPSQPQAQPQMQEPSVATVSTEEEELAVEMIAELISRIDGVTERLAAA